jgi:hypothetical protein
MGEGIVQRRFEVIKIAEQAGHGGKKLPRFGAIEEEQVIGEAARALRALGPTAQSWWATLRIYSP